MVAFVIPDDALFSVALNAVATMTLPIPTCALLLILGDTSLNAIDILCLKSFQFFTYCVKSNLNMFLDVITAFVSQKHQNRTSSNI